jgi:SAM-dependent methyltransferase
MLDAIEQIASAPRPAVPWRDGVRYPWHDPKFSERTLRVHLDQTTHMASRSLLVIKQHVRWLLNLLRTEIPQRYRPDVLDVGCGPGLYCHELARRGGNALGLDVAPAPLAYARKVAKDEGLDCRFWEADLEELPADFPDRIGPVDAVAFWYGEFHAFQPRTAGRFIAKLAECLVPGGLFIVEYQPYDLFIKEDSQEWQACRQSIFSDRPHLWLEEYCWHEESQAEINVHWIIDAQSGELERYAQSHQAYQDAELIGLFRSCGLGRPRFYPPITGVSRRYEFPLLVTRKKDK